MATVFGRAFLTVNGKRYNSKNGATFKKGGISREPVVGDSGLAGNQKKIEPGQVDLTIIADANTSMTELEKIEDAAVTFDGDDGKSYISEDAFCGPLVEKSTDGYKMTIYGSFKEV